MIKIFNYSISYNSIIAFFFTYIGYTILSNLLHYTYFYNNSKKSLNKWKIQPNKNDNIGTFHFSLGFSIKKNNAAPYHSLIGFINLFNVCLMASILTELTINNKTSLNFNEINQFGTINIIKYFFIAFIYENIIEYYWHRAMHLSLFYKTFHKYHHYYKYPEPFDDMYIHPLEAIGYYMILLSPPFLFNMHIYSFLMYMIVMGVCGICDHSGIKFKIPLLYDSVDHDLHHSQFEINYAFPFPFMDVLHGTYEGHFLGKEYKRKRHNIK